VPAAQPTAAPKPAATAVPANQPAAPTPKPQAQASVANASGIAPTPTPRH